jgi:hypothetical protein
MRLVNPEDVEDAAIIEGDVIDVDSVLGDDPENDDIVEEPNG